MKTSGENLTVFTVEDDIANMKKHRDKFIKAMGKETYKRLLKKLKDYKKKKDQDGRA